MGGRELFGWHLGQTWEMNEASLGIRRITLYKHGLAHIERAGSFEGDQFEMTFPTDAMDDVLKSLVIVDDSGGVVHGVDVERAEDRDQRLAEEPLQLSAERSLLDLLRDLRGHAVTVKRREGGEVSGTVIGIDIEDDDALKRPMLSVLTESGAIVPLLVSSVEDIRLADDAETDVRRVLRTWRGQDRARSATVRLSPGVHQLRVAHLMPAPAWRVSYRLVVEGDAMLLQGWGLFDNTFDEDLDGVSVTLVAGMPVSFRYRLYEGHIPDRPEMADESRTMASAVEFAAMAEPVGAFAVSASAPRGRMSKNMSDAAGGEMRSMSMADMETTTAPTASGEDRGALFAYVVPEPVSAGRGRSVLVPLVSQRVEGRRELLYKSGSAVNGNPPSPIASLRLTNSTGLTLERGPVTVLEHGGYGGEAIVTFSPPGASFVVPYAVELGVRITEERDHRTVVKSLRVQDRYLVVTEDIIATTKYRISSSLSADVVVTIEHPQRVGWSLLDTAAPRECGDGAARWDVAAPAAGQATLVITEVQPQSRGEHVRGLDGDQLRAFLADRRIDQALHDGLGEIMALYGRLDDIDRQRSDNADAKSDLHERQEQARANLGALGTSGDEGSLRQRYVAIISESEDRLATVQASDDTLATEYATIESNINTKLDALSSRRTDD
jgi:hypothetical protein